MFNRFTKDARRIVEDAIEVARELGATTVEAEHLLLAVTRRDTPVALVLSRHGLDDEGLRAALVAETERSLAAVGVTAESLTFSPFLDTPRLAASARSALELALRVALERGDHRIGVGHVVLGALRPARGTVPRALAIAGVDREQLGAAVGAVT